MARMSDYPSVDTLSAQEKQNYLDSASIVTVGKRNPNSNLENYSVPVSGIGGGGADLPPYSDEEKAVLANQAGNLSWDKGFASTSYVEEKINQFIVYDPLEGGGSAGNFKTLSLCHDDTLDVVENKEHPGWTRVLTVKTPLPAPDSGYSDEGKILRVGIANELEWVNSSAVVEVDNTTIGYDQYGSLEVKLPIPDPTNNDGKVLTVEHNTLTNTDDVVWKDAGGGGGGGGNPYTKVSVTPGARYKNGTRSDYGFDLFDQDVNISNNTYSVVNTEIGYDSSAESPDARTIDKFKIKLPANTDFPMAVVEFRVYHYEDMFEFGAVNDVEVYVGETKLTKLLQHPFRMDTLTGTNLYSDEKQAGEGGYSGYYINGIWSSNTLSYRTAFVATEEVTPIVQVHIFGNCFTLSTNAEAEEPSAS
jgi:hypothetical protein